MDDSPLFDRLPKGSQWERRKSYEGKHINSPCKGYHPRDTSRSQHRRDFEILPAKGRRRRQTTRQARWLDQVTFQIWDYPQETFGESSEEYFGWYDSEDEDIDECFWGSDSNLDSNSDADSDSLDSESYSLESFWFLNYLPGGPNISI